MIFLRFRRITLFCIFLLLKQKRSTSEFPVLLSINNCSLKILFPFVFNSISKQFNIIENLGMFILRYPAYVCGLLRVRISTLYKRQVKYRGAWIVHHHSLMDYTCISHHQMRKLYRVVLVDHPKSRK